MSIWQVYPNVYQNVWLIFNLFPIEREITSMVKIIKEMIREHSSSAYSKFSEKLTFLTLWYAHVNLGNFAYVLVKWSLKNLAFCRETYNLIINYFKGRYFFQTRLLKPTAKITCLFVLVSERKYTLKPRLNFLQQN